MRWARSPREMSVKSPAGRSLCIATRCQEDKESQVPCRWSSRDDVPVDDPGESVVVHDVVPFSPTSRLFPYRPGWTGASPPHRTVCRGGRWRMAKGESSVCPSIRPVVGRGSADGSSTSSPGGPRSRTLEVLVLTDTHWTSALALYRSWSPAVPREVCASAGRQWGWRCSLAVGPASPREPSPGLPFSPALRRVSLRTSPPPDQPSPAERSPHGHPSLSP